MLGCLCNAFLFSIDAFESIEERLKQAKLSEDERNDIMNLVYKKVKSNREENHVQRREDDVHRIKDKLEKEKTRLEKDMDLAKEKVENELKDEKKNYEEKIRLMKDEPKNVGKRTELAKDFVDLIQRKKNDFEKEVTNMREHLHNFGCIVKNEFENEVLELKWLLDDLQNNFINTEMDDFDEKKESKKKEFSDFANTLKKSLGIEKEKAW